MESEDTSSVEKTVLVCFGERKREVSFSSNDVKQDLEVLCSAIKRVFCDVVKTDGDLVVQLKDENWGGEFVDLKGGASIPNRAVVKVVLVGEALSPSERISGAVSQISRPTLGEAKVLRKLFPSSSGACKKATFDPTSRCVASELQRKKKATSSQGRPTSIQVVMLKSMCTSIPRGRHRTGLTKAGRIQTLQFRRSMSAEEVNARIRQGFKDVKGTHWKALDSSSNTLSLAEKQELNGEAVINRKGSLYLCQESPASTSEESDARSNSQEKRKPIIIEESSSSSDDSDLPRVNVKRPHVLEEEIQARRSLVAEQNAEYERSLQVDQEKDRQKAKERTRDEKLQLIRSDLRPKFSADIDGGISLAFRLPSGKRVEHQFATNSQVKDIYDYVFSVELIDPPFSLYFSFPRSKIPASEDLLQDLVTEPAPLITVEVPGDYDPIGNGSESQVSTAAVVSNIDNFMSTLHQAQRERERFITGLQFPIGTHHIIRRNNVFGDVMELYKSEELKEFPFKIKFEGEKALDFGGVTRDLFSAFFKEMYSKFFDGTCLVTPSIYPGTDLDELPILGFIISHANLVSGVLPVRIAFPCLAGILSSVSGLPEEVLLSAFIDSLSIHDAKIVIKALKEVKEDLPSFSADVSCNLQLVLSFYQIREIPRPATLARILLQIAWCEFKTKPAAAIQAIRSGIPEYHKPFWNRTSISTFYSIYKALSVSTAKVLKLVKEVITNNPSEERVLSYLRQFIGNMRGDELRVFLRFVTGSCVCTASGINVTFNGLEGLARRPLVHTCSCTIELPTTYFNYADFSSEFEAVLNSEEQSWSMNAI